MSLRKILLNACVSGALFAMGSHALAADGSRGDMPRTFDRVAMHKQMCTDRFAHNAGRIAYIEAKLSLTDNQRPVFETWKQAVLSSAKAQQDKCLARQDHMGQHNILERQARMMQRLQSRMADMTAERPSLEALYNALSPEQKQVFDLGNRMGPGGHRPQEHGGWHDHGPHGAPSDKA